MLALEAKKRSGGFFQFVSSLNSLSTKSADTWSSTISVCICQMCLTAVVMNNLRNSYFKVGVWNRASVWPSEQMKTRR